jgi:hypothetical protein
MGTANFLLQLGGSYSNNPNHPAYDTLLTDDCGSSWDMGDSDSNINIERFDSWNVLKDEYVNGYGGGGAMGGGLDFRILGTSAEDTSATPHVLSPPLMESLQ